MKAFVEALKSAVESAQVTGIFLSKKQLLGAPRSTAATREWTHFSVTLAKDALLKSPLQTPFQAMAEKREDHKNMTKALADFSSKTLTSAVNVLKSNSLYRNEKVLGAAEWLKKLHVKYHAVKNKVARDNLLWLEIATAPAGYCHPRSSMIGTLLEDIEAGMDFNEVKTRFEAKMHPLLYQRPQAAPKAAPKAGNIARGEKIFKELGAERSLNRRFARLEELVTLWISKTALDAPDPPKRVGIFSHLQPKPALSKSVNAMAIPPVTMTWSKFRSTILEEAELVEYYIPNRKGNFSAMLTASDMTAPPILQWDKPDRRNPFSSYVYHNGSDPSDWNLKVDNWCKVNAVTLMPAHWYSDKLEHHGKSALFVLEQAKDMRYKTAGNAIFPENLKAEFREIRSTIEFYSKGAEIDGFEEASACGIIFDSHGSENDFALRVTTTDGCQEYKLDRWD